MIDSPPVVCCQCSVKTSLKHGLPENYFYIISLALFLIFNFKYLYIRVSCTQYDYYFYFVHIIGGLLFYIFFLNWSSKPSSVCPGFKAFTWPTCIWFLSFPKTSFPIKMLLSRDSSQVSSGYRMLPPLYIHLL